MHGFIVLNKDKGVTSNKACQIIKRILNIEKVGHSGTLDPETTGVLVVAIGKATKCIPLLDDQFKVYQAEALFGYSTDTQDIYGEIQKRTEVLSFTIEDLDQAIVELSHTTTQIPPMFSAIKIKGKKLYDLARKGKEVERVARPIKIYELKRTSEVKFETNQATFQLRVCGSRGIYVRTILYDLGQMMGIESCMKALTRTESGRFTLKQSSTLEEIKKGNYHLLSLEEVFDDYPKVEVNEYIAKLVQNGVIIDERQTNLQSNIRVYHGNQFLGIYAYNGKNYVPIVTF